jgi:putative transposon-encoded protein
MTTKPRKSWASLANTIEIGREGRVTAFGKSALDIARINKRDAILKLFGVES